MKSLGASALLICAAVALWTGCGKEEADPDPGVLTIEQATAADAPAPAPNQTQPAPTPQQAQASYDATIADRAIVFAQGQLARKNFRAVRNSLAQLDQMQLTPAQRQKVDAIKAQVPPQ